MEGLEGRKGKMLYYIITSKIKEKHIKRREAAFIHQLPLLCIPRSSHIVKFQKAFPFLERTDREDRQTGQTERTGRCIYYFCIAVIKYWTKTNERKLLIFSQGFRGFRPWLLGPQ